MSRLDDRKQAREGLKATLVRQPAVAAVDLGASKVTCFIMKPDGVHRDNRTLTTAGVGYVQSRGVRGGAIVNLDEAARSHRPGGRAGRDRGRRQRPGRHASATAGGQLASHRVQAQVSLGARPIGDSDLVRAIQHGAGPDQAFPAAGPIHLLPIAWSVDGQGGVRDPRAMFGRTLGVELLVVSIAETVFHTLGALRRARPPAVRRRGRRALRLGPGRPGRGRDGPGLRSASTWAAARPRRRCSPAAAWCHVDSLCRSAAST